MESELTGKLLVATPSLDDSFFKQAVVYVVMHNEEGAMGVVVNNIIRDITYQDVFSQLGISASGAITYNPVRLGGPVEAEKGFILHSNEYKTDNTKEINADFSITSSLDILRDIATNSGPEKSLMLLGYAGWSAGQLEQEICEDSWFVVPAEERLVFGIEDIEKWPEAMRFLQIDMSRYSTEIGHA